MYLKSPYGDVPNLPEQNVHHFIFDRPEQASWPDYTLHIDSATGKRRRFREFKERVRDGATALGAPISEGGLGLRNEDNEIVGIFGENSMDYIALVHSLIVITTPIALISSYSTRFELKHALQLSKSTRLFVDAKFLSLVLPVAHEAGISSEKIYVLEGRNDHHKSFSGLIDSVWEKRIPRVAVRPATKDTLAYLVFSSGTSGLPKAVMISHSNIVHSAIVHPTIVANAVAEVYTPPAFPTPEGIPVSLATLPVHHTYGLHQFCFRAFVTPVTYIIFAKWDAKRVLQLIPKYKITTLPLIPSVVHQLVNHPDIHKADLTSVMYIHSGAAYLPPILGKKLLSYAKKDTFFTDGYGMSEATNAACIQPHPGVLGGLQPIIGSCGIMQAGMEARIIRDDGSDADVNEIGELLLRGPTISLGYWNNPKANKDTFIDGWLHTGDKFRIDEKGFFFFADRAKDTLKVSGAQVSPMEIEAVLLAHPQHLIVDASVAGVSGGRTEDEKVPRAWIVLSDIGKKKGSAAVIKVLDAWHRENLSKYKWLRGGFEIVDEIPKSPTGKTLRRVLQDRYEQRAAQKAKSKL